MQVIQLLGSTLGIALMSGVNLYATVLTIGLGTRLGFIDLPAQLSGLEVLSNPLLLIVAGVMYAVEFLVDKIPWLDSLWDSIHTVIRPIEGRRKAHGEPDNQGPEDEAADQLHGASIPNENN